MELLPYGNTIRCSFDEDVALHTVYGRTCLHSCCTLSGPTTSALKCEGFVICWETRSSDQGT